MSDSSIAHDGAHRIKQAIGYSSRAVASAIKKILRWQPTWVFLASTDVLAIVGKTQFEEFKQLKGDGRSHKNA
ncbi:hypothetical protein QUA00_29690 [Microcoleus sp. T2B6]|uniref:hypothetical protein n=1 Tax=unclassified Microcoleus TaxID=2642155 RepID=UPI002FD4BA53